MKSPNTSQEGERNQPDRASGRFPDVEIVDEQPATEFSKSILMMTCIAVLKEFL